jgi:hypothetical protein
LRERGSHTDPSAAIGRRHKLVTEAPQFATNHSREIQTI